MESRIRSALGAAFNAAVAEQTQLTNLGGHASLRIYWRIESAQALFEDDKTLIAMVLPEDFSLDQSDEATSGDTPNELPFITVQRMLKSWDLRVPEIVFADMDLGVLLLEDLGDVMFEHIVLDPEQKIEAYKEAIELLATFQRAAFAAEPKRELCWSRQFDDELLRWELDHYIEWGVDALDKSVGVSSDEIDGVFSSLVQELVELPTSLVLRDYQSRNIMRKSDEWVLIDFQDALVGPFIYDLVALLRDSYVQLAPEEVDLLVDHYAEQDLPWSLTRDEIRRAFYLQTVQRKLKDTGRFVYIDQVKKNSSFLQYYDPSLAYVQHAITQIPGYDTDVWRAITQQ